MIGVYALLNFLDGKIYVGSSINMNSRWNKVEKK